MFVKTLAIRVLTATIILGSLLHSAKAADTFYIRSGPDRGEILVSTPWGDYAAYDEGSGDYWVGTKKEYDRNRAAAIMQDHYRLSTVHIDAGATAEFVEANTYRAHVSNIALDEIVPEVAFNDPVAGHGPSAYHTLSVTWIQASPVIVTCFVFDRERHYVYVPSPVDISQEWRNVVFGLPNDLFKRPLVLIFIAHGRQPGFVGLSSVTRSDYAYVKGRLSEMNTPEDEQQLKRLLVFDSGLSHGAVVAPGIKSAAPNASEPNSSPTASPSTVAVSRQASTYYFSGPIKDDIAGNGTIELRFEDNGYGAVSNTWSTNFSDTARNSQGTVVGSPFSGPSFYLEAQGACPYLAYHIERTADGGFSAKYKGIECRNGGTLTVSPVNGSTEGHVNGSSEAAPNVSGVSPVAPTSPVGQSALLHAGDKWSGVIDDRRGGRGQLTLSFSGTAVPNSSPFGQFEALFGGNFSNEGDITRLQQRGSALSFYLESRREPTCVYLVNASIDQGGVMRGSYRGCFANGGTFELRIH